MFLLSLLCVLKPFWTPCLNVALVVIVLHVFFFNIILIFLRLVLMFQNIFLHLYLKRRNRERSSFHWPTNQKYRSCSNLKPGATGLLRVSSVTAGTKGHEPCLAAIPGHSIELDRKWRASQDTEDNKAKPKGSLLNHSTNSLCVLTDFEHLLCLELCQF